MSESLPGIIIAILLGGSLVAWLVTLPWTIKDTRQQQRDGTTSGVIGSVDEAFHPEAFQAALIWEAENRAPAPSPTSGDDLFPEGKIRLTP